jgi:hypothetical protein
MERAKSVSWATPDPSQVPPPATTAHQVSFFRLTPELRVYIYRLLYQRKTEIWLTGHLAHHCGPDRIETGLLLSCREIYNESSAVLYDTNSFAVNGRARSGEILERLGTQACSYLKRLRIWSIPLEFSELERQLICEKTPFPPLNLDHSIWGCVSHHLQSLETIELGTFGDDFFAVISRCTSSIRLVDRKRPPPLIEIEVWEKASTSSLEPTRSSVSHASQFDVAFTERDKALWLPSLRSIRLIGRLNAADCKYLQKDVHRYYVVSGVKNLDTSDMHSVYGDDSAVLITLRMRTKIMDYAILSDKEVERKTGELGVGFEDGKKEEEAERRHLFDDLGLAILDPDQDDEYTLGDMAAEEDEDEGMWDEQQTDETDLVEAPSVECMTAISNSCVLSFSGLA